MTGIAISTTPAPSAPTVPEWLPGGLAAAGMALIVLVLLLRMSKQRKRQRARAGGEHLSAKERMQRVREQANQARPESAAIEKLMVDAQDLTRACAAQLETRTRHLERLLKEADERIARLETLRDQPAHDRSATVEEETRSLDGIGFPMADSRVRTRREPIENVLEAHDAPRPGSHQRDPLAQRVLELHRDGLTAVEIAQELGEQVGRVELMLALQRV